MIIDVKNTKQYHAIRKIQKKYELLLKISKSTGDTECIAKLETRLKVATECLNAILELR